MYTKSLSGIWEPFSLARCGCGTALLPLVVSFPCRAFPCLCIPLDHVTDAVVQQGQIRSADGESADLADIATDIGRYCSRGLDTFEPVVFGIPPFLMASAFCCYLSHGGRLVWDCSTPLVMVCSWSGRDST